jgi:hypothetical protein
LLLSGCDSLKDTFGLSRDTPDEFNVTPAPPLTIPKDYKLSPPCLSPTPKPASGESNVSDAKNVVLGKKKSPNLVSGTKTETKIIDNASQTTGTSDSQIREKVDKEASVETNELSAILKGKIEEFKKNIASLDNKDSKVSQES